MTLTAKQRRELHKLYAQDPDTYSGSAVGQRITRQRALREIRDHGCDDAQSVADFDTEVEPGRDGLYDAVEILAWLGY